MQYAELVDVAIQYSKWGQEFLASILATAPFEGQNQDLHGSSRKAAMQSNI